MCTVIIGVLPNRVVLAANRDERFSRAWDFPAEHWPRVIGGRDRTAGGTWLAVNAAGVACAVLNRVGSLGPEAGKRSRGALPLQALAADSARASAGLIAQLDAARFRPFNMVIADPADAWFVRGTGEGRPEARRLPSGISVVTAHDLDDLTPRARRHAPLFAHAPAPTSSDHAAWAALLLDDSGAPEDQLRVKRQQLPGGDAFGTVCSAIVFPGQAFLFGVDALAPVPLDGLAGPPGAQA